tara:strand:+ start:1684 stop:1887 length:204 start_codon:yes stop_codon:yes gene_type:complete
MSSEHPPQGAYPEVGKADFPNLEARILERWAAEGTFQASVDARSSDDEFTFNDGPPFANGSPTMATS